MRNLEIGPTTKHVKGYETAGMEFATHKCDVSGSMPFEDNTFDRILASHVIEHIEWYKTQAALTEWTRILKVGGEIELWTPDINKAIEILNRAEYGLDVPIEWIDANEGLMRKYNKQNDPYLWANYRIFAGENPKAKLQYSRWHKSMFTFGHLKNQMENAGLRDVHRINKKPPYDHGWANMGVIGTK